MSGRDDDVRERAGPGTGSLCGQCLCVGLDVLHDDDDLPIRALRDCIPDGQAVRRKMETVSTWQRVCLGKRFGKRRDWFLEQERFVRVPISRLAVTRNSARSWRSRSDKEGDRRPVPVGPSSRLARLSSKV